MIRPIQRLPSVLLLLERLLKYTPLSHPDYQQLNNTMDKLREVARKLNEERGKTEKHLSLFSIVNSIDNCPVSSSISLRRKSSFTIICYLA
jgi:protein ECT2